MGSALPVGGPSLNRAEPWLWQSVNGGLSGASSRRRLAGEIQHNARLDRVFSVLQNQIAQMSIDLTPFPTCNPTQPVNPQPARVRRR